jgi:hypothetical protein
MKIYGVDFTSTPSQRKPITCAEARLNGSNLSITTAQTFGDFSQFEFFLNTLGPCRAGFDFPFGQPRRLLENLKMTGGWKDAVMKLTHGERSDFVGRLDAYRANRPKGDKQHRRKVDELARSCSPMMLYGTPVAKMYFEGAPRLFKAGLCILPMSPNDDLRVAVEAYPKLVAERYADGGKYKADDKVRQTIGRLETREKIVCGLEAYAKRDFGIAIQIAPTVRQAAVDDPTGDILDAVLCSVQAAWSASLPSDASNGIPDDCDTLEGWIVDPSLLNGRMMRSLPL